MGGGWGGGYASPSVYDFTSAPIARTCAVGQDPFYGTIMTGPPLGAGGEDGLVMKNYRRRSTGMVMGVRGWTDDPQCTYEESMVIKDTVGRKKVDGAVEHRSVGVVSCEDGGSSVTGDDDDGSVVVVEEIHNSSLFGEDYESSIGPWDDAGGIGEIYGLGAKPRRSSLVGGLKSARDKARRKKPKNQKGSSKHGKQARGLRNMKDNATTIDPNMKKPHTDTPAKNRRRTFMKGRRASIMGPPPLLREHVSYEDPKSDDSMSRKTSSTSSQESERSSQGNRQNTTELSGTKEHSPFHRPGSPTEAVSPRSSSCTSAEQEIYVTRKRNLSSPKAAPPDRKQREGRSRPPVYGDTSKSRRKTSSSSRDSKSSSGSKSGSRLSFSFLSLINGRKSSGAAPPPPYWDAGDNVSEVEPGTGLSDWKPSDYADDDYVVFVQQKGSPLKPKRASYIQRLVTGKVH